MAINILWKTNRPSRKALYLSWNDNIRPFYGSHFYITKIESLHRQIVKIGRRTLSKNSKNSRVCYSNLLRWRQVKNCCRKSWHSFIRLYSLRILAHCQYKAVRIKYFIYHAHNIWKMARWRTRSENSFELRFV